MIFDFNKEEIKIIRKALDIYGDILEERGWVEKSDMAYDLADKIKERIRGN